jgi:hypothetical protein
MIPYTEALSKEHQDIAKMFFAPDVLGGSLSDKISGNCEYVRFIDKNSVQLEGFFTLKDLEAIVGFMQLIK